MIELFHSITQITGEDYTDCWGRLHRLPKKITRSIEEDYTDCWRRLHGLMKKITQIILVNPKLQAQNPNQPINHSTLQPFYYLYFSFAGSQTADRLAVK